MTVLISSDLLDSVQFKNRIFFFLLTGHNMFAQPTSFSFQLPEHKMSPCSHMPGLLMVCLCVSVQSGWSQ